MKVYTLGTKIDHTYGHGCSGTEIHIIPQGSYVSGDFPPLFESKADAQDFLSNKPDRYRMCIVELNIID